MFNVQSSRDYKIDFGKILSLDGAHKRHISSQLLTKEKHNLHKETVKRFNSIFMKYIIKDKHIKEKSTEV